MALAQMLNNQPVEITTSTVLHDNTQSSLQTLHSWTEAERNAAGIYTIEEPPPVDPTLTVTGRTLAMVDNKVVRTNITAPRVVDKSEVDAERDRRLQRFQFAGVTFDFGGSSTVDIAGAGTLALAAIINGAQAGNLRWADANADFGWIARNNTIVPMDAQTTFAFGQAAAKWRGDHIHAARVIKDMSPIPLDFAADARWPA